MSQQTCTECCEHFTGRSTTDGLAQSGTDEVRCCFCGGTRNRRWTVKRIAPDGHGPYAGEDVKVFDDEQRRGGSGTTP